MSEGLSPIETGSFPRVEALINVISDWLQHRREIAETCNCDVGDLDRTARELGVSGEELAALVCLGHHSADELPKLMKAIKLDPDAAQMQALIMRDMERVCAHCTQKSRCNDALANGTARQRYDEYCGNTQTLQGLGAVVPVKVTLTDSQPSDDEGAAEARSHQTRYVRMSLDR